MLLAQDVGLTATAPTKDLRIGQTVEVTVEARLPAEVDSIGPMAADSAGLFQIFGVKRHDDARAWTFELMTIDTGSVFLPPMAFGYVVKGDTTLRKAYTNSLLFSVKGFAVAPEADIKDIKPPLTAPWRWEDIWPYLVGILVIAAGYLAYRRYLKKRPADEPEPEPLPEVPPHVLALRELRMLEEKKLWQQGNVKGYYSEVTEIVRRFFEGRWRIPALEMTSDEIFEALRHRPEWTSLGEAGRLFFRRADLVKFAKGQPDAEEHVKTLESAYAIVRSMTPAPQPAETVQPKEATVDVG